MTPLIQFWINGGPVLWALLILALLIYFPLCTLASNIRNLLQGETPQATFSEASFGRQRQSRAPLTQTDPLDEALHAATLDRGLRLEVAAEINQRLRHLSVLIHLAPLLGLFGTVNGIYQTFRALAERSATISDMMSSGISEALITTAMGLLIAIPAVFLLQLTKQQLSLWVHSPCPFPELAIEEATGSKSR